MADIITPKRERWGQRGVFTPPAGPGRAMYYSPFGAFASLADPSLPVAMNMPYLGINLTQAGGATTTQVIKLVRIVPQVSMTCSTVYTCSGTAVAA